MGVVNVIRTLCSVLDFPLAIGVRIIEVGLYYEVLTISIIIICAVGMDIGLVCVCYCTNCWTIIYINFVSTAREAS